LTRSFIIANRMSKSPETFICMGSNTVTSITKVDPATRYNLKLFGRRQTLLPDLFKFSFAFFLGLTLVARRFFGPRA